jgi:hypothetical protein
MTDYTDLIARLRDYDCCTVGPQETADALEAQARRIAGYQKDADDYLIRLDELNALRDRIAELKAALVKVGYDFTLSRDELAVIAREELRLK